MKQDNGLHRIPGKLVPDCLAEYTGDHEGSKCRSCEFGVLCMFVMLAENIGEWQNDKKDG